MKAKHELKIEPKYFEAVKDGRKKFEIRKNDRGFQEGDLLILREYDPITQEYLGRIMKVEISYMTDYAQQDGYVVLGIEEIWEGLDG
ncbi:ASCH/PUA domain-containing protein [Carnobacterium maltaromaticum]|uniref:ASCH/PUA domain-containing protein n=1 Tax=Carnobacterium maltaromaticum TaxID=2751 RepID=UPI0039B0CBF5